jgi:hypothetical protein
MIHDRVLVLLERASTRPEITRPFYCGSEGEVSRTVIDNVYPVSEYFAFSKIFVEKVFGVNALKNKYLLYNAPKE